MELCDKESQLEIIIENINKIEETSAEWNLSKEERRQLYQQCSAILNNSNFMYLIHFCYLFRKGAYITTKAYLKLFEKSSLEELK